MHAMTLQGALRGALALLVIVGWIFVQANVRAARSPDEPQRPEEPGGRQGPFVGHFLVATPKMADPRFVNTVVLVLEHRPDEANGGAMGLVINRPIGTGPLGVLLKDSPIDFDKQYADFQVALFYGGPVEGYLAFILHSDDYKGGPGTYPVRGMAHGRVMVSTDASVLVRIAEGKGPSHALFVLGYSGWGPGQLDREIADGAWVLVPADADLVFGPDRGDALWRKTWALRGVDL